VKLYCVCDAGGMRLPVGSEDICGGFECVVLDVRLCYKVEGEGGGVVFVLVMGSRRVRASSNAPKPFVAPLTPDEGQAIKCGREGGMRAVGIVLCLLASVLPSLMPRPS
jgi:hypothetical protein